MSLFHARRRSQFEAVREDRSRGVGVEMGDGPPPFRKKSDSDAAGQAPSSSPPVFGDKLDSSAGGGAVPSSSPPSFGQNAAVSSAPPAGPVGVPNARQPVGQPDFSAAPAQMSFPAAAKGGKGSRSVRGLAVARRARALVWVLGIGSLLGIGASGGWWLRDVYSPTPEVTEFNAVIDRPIIVQQDAGRGDGRMPDIVGLDVEQATRVLVDAGLLPEQIEVVDRPSARAEGEIVGQDPAPGVDGLSVVTLWRSTSAAMPNLVGQGIDEARVELQDLGARVTVTRRYEPNVAPDRVVSTQPGRGENVPQSVALVVSEPGASVFLQQLRADESSDCFFSDVTIGATPFSNGVYCDPDRDDIAYLEYVTGPDVAQLSGTIGRPLSSDQGVSTVASILVDGVVVSKFDIAGSAAEDVTIDVRGGSRVRIEVERTSARDERGDVFVAFGDFRFTGSSTAIETVLRENQ